MTSVVVTLNPQDEIAVRRYFLRLSEGLMSNSLRQWVYTNARPYLQSRARRRFETEGDDVTGPWAELSLATQGFRRRHGFPPEHPINVRTGGLRQYVTQTYDMTEGWREVTFNMPGRADNSVIRKKYRAAQRGGVGKSGLPFPARPVIAMNENDQRRLTDRFAGWVNGMLRTIA